VDIVVVATPNKYLAEIGIAALEAGKHVLIEKPMGRNTKEAEALAHAAKTSGRLLKIGFNHRYHPGIAAAYGAWSDNKIGSIINARVRYGHGARPGYEKEWRGNPELAGGGELTDQGVHVIDLISWFLGPADEAFCWQQTAVWPIAPLEDNGFVLLRYPENTVVSFHTSWTQWKNLFSLEIFGTKGALVVEGLGGSYGTETLTHWTRKLEGGAPVKEHQIFDGPDLSWEIEWSEFIGAIERGDGAYLGTPQDGLIVMRTLEALYASVESNRPEKVPE
jgi:predicted dehydrogenase